MGCIISNDKWINTKTILKQYKSVLSDREELDILCSIAGKNLSLKNINQLNLIFNNQVIGEIICIWCDKNRIIHLGFRTIILYRTCISKNRLISKVYDQKKFISHRR